ncbi:MAG: DUF2480 family protein [Puia sp.]|nr:DUF2480 family protein [Puia sp.]
MSEEILNKVAQSAIVSIDLEDYYPRQETVLFDLKPYLFMEQILREKDFRASLQTIDWSSYQDKIVAVTCTVDAIIPAWAFMLIASYLQPIATAVVMGDERTALQRTFLDRIASIDAAAFTDKRVVVKGCGDLDIGSVAYMEITKLLRPVVKSIMYGEPCSTVPVYKRK